MVGDLTVAQNIFIGREPKKGFRVDDKKMIEDSRKLFQDLNIEIDPYGVRCIQYQDSSYEGL